MKPPLSLYIPMFAEVMAWLTGIKQLLCQSAPIERYYPAPFALLVSVPIGS
jgi:hypothetical protein